MFESRKTIFNFTDDGDKVVIPNINSVSYVKKEKNKFHIAYKCAISFAVAVCFLFSAIGILPMFTNQNSKSSGFTIVACAAEPSSNKNASVTLANNTSVALPWVKLLRSDDGLYADYSTAQFKITGDNIEAVTLTLSAGELFYTAADVEVSISKGKITLGDPTTAEAEKHKLTNLNSNDYTQTGKSITVYPGTLLASGFRVPSEVRTMWYPSDEMLHKIITGESITNCNDTMTITIKTKDGQTIINKLFLSFTKDGVLHAELKN